MEVDLLGELPLELPLTDDVPRAAKQLSHSGLQAGFRTL
jgi:hypothetical protein